MNLMMRLSLLILTFIFLLSIDMCKAQVDTIPICANHKIFLSISSGFSMPVGEFSYFKEDNYSPNENLAGGANNGFNGKFDVKYFFNKTFGITCAFYSTRNNVIVPDSDELFLPPSTAMGGGSRMLSYNYSAKRWYSNGILAGPVIAIDNENNYVNLNLRIAGGIQQVQCPETILNETGYYWQGGWTIHHPYKLSTIQPRIISYSFVFDGGIDYKLNLIRKFDIIFSIDYLISRGKFVGQSTQTSDVDDGINNTHTEALIPVNFSKKNAQLYFNLGINYILK